MAGKRVFLSYAVEDQFRLPSLLAAFAAWDVVSSTLDPMQQPPGQLLADTVQEIHQCPVYLRLCTGATRLSPQVTLADAAFNTLLEADRRKGQQGKRRLVNLILDPAYTPGEQDKATLYIDTAGKTRALWLEELAAPLDVATLKQRVSRRALLGMGVGAALTVISAGAAGTIYVQQQRQIQAAQRVIPNTTHLSGNPRWSIPLGAFNNQSDVSSALFNDNGSIYVAAIDAVFASSYATSGQSNVVGSSGLFAISAKAKIARFIPMALSAEDLFDPASLCISGGLVFVSYTTNINAVSVSYTPSAFRVSDGGLAFHFAGELFTNPKAVGDSFYCLNVTESNATYVNAFDSRTGSLRWRQPIVFEGHDLNSIGEFDLLRVVGGVVYVSAFDDTLTSYDAASGHIRWRKLVDGQATPPVVVDGIVYVGARDGSLHALDEASGASRWRTMTEDGFAAPPTVSDGVLYIGSVGGYLYAFDVATGKLYWRSLLGSPNGNSPTFQIAAAPALYRNVVTVASTDILFAFDLRDGSPRWHYEPVAGSETSISPPITDQGLFLIGSPDGKVYAINP